MLKLFTKITLPALLLSLLVGCGGSSNKELEGLNDVEYKIVQERLDFEKNQNADINFEIDKNTDESLTMLLDAHTKIMYKINLKGEKNSKIKSILNVTLNSTGRINIHKLLIERKDYYFDSVNNALYVAIEVPYIYLLDKKCSLTLDLTMATKKRYLAKRSIKMLYETAPMRDNGENYMSFAYEKSFESDDVDEFILSMIQSELKQANLAHFDAAYKKRHNTFFQEIEQ